MSLHYLFDVSSHTEREPINFEQDNYTNYINDTIAWSFRLDLMYCI